MSRTGIEREFVRLTVDLGERHFHGPLRRIRYDLAECACGGIVREHYGAWREIGRWRYWRLRRRGYWREPTKEGTL